MNRFSFGIVYKNVARYKCFVLAALFGAFLTLPTGAHAFLKVCNESTETVFVALGYNEDGDWLAEGWWEIRPRDCEYLIDGSLPDRYYYLRAEGAKGTVWEGDYLFCVTDTKFTLVDYEGCVTRRVDRVGFFQMDTENYSSWTQTLN